MRFNNKNVTLPAPISVYTLYNYIHMDATDYADSKYGYIDINYVPTLTTNVEITVNLANDTFDVGGTGDSFVFGMNGNQGLWQPYDGYGMRIRTNLHPTYWFEPTYGNKYEDEVITITPLTDTTFRFDQTSSNIFTLYKDGVLITNKTSNWPLASLLQNLSFFVFATNNLYGSYYYGHPAERVKEIKIYEGSTLVRDYKPALDSNSTACLVDVLNDICYYSTGQGGMVVEN